MTLRPSIYDAEVGGILRHVLEALRTVPATAWITFDVVESASNAVMFLPFGLLVIAWRGRWWHGILGALLVSAGIETWQLLFLPTRVADVRDVVANTLGAALGVGLAILVRRWGDRSQRAHSRRHRKVIGSRAQ
ncbi:glycopeptide antibiotics resistance protein [Microbacterium proteolyticum]|nr:glycopeptide antibiotics resistance protein [Microbacterium sp. SORGH_AS_0344]MDQ1170285.1 glycopeptide antibiotics resistance protein [Microbacterium proteolyticum]